MRSPKWILLCILGLAVLTSYLIGSFCPVDFLRPNLVNKDITLNEIYTRVATIIAAFMTFLAVMVALFKEDIRKYWEYAKLELKTRDKKGFREVLEDTPPSTSGQPSKIVQRYESILIIENIGTISAKNCEIYIESLKCNNENYIEPNEVPYNHEPLKWIHNDSASTILHSKGKGYVKIAEIRPQNKVAKPNNKEIIEPPKIIIGNIEPSPQFQNGTWNIALLICSENADTTRCILTIKWNGKWHDREADMSNLTLDLKIIK